MGEFAILFLLLWRAFRMHGVVNGKAIALGAVIALAYAGSDEFHQGFVIGRTASVKDVAYDLTGIACAATLTLLARKQSQEKVT